MSSGFFETERMARSYFEAWMRRDTGATRALSFQMYDTSKRDRTVRIVEYLSIRDGRVASSTFIADMSAFTGLMGP